MQKRKSPELVGASEPGLENNSRKQNSKTPQKWKRVLAAFVNGRTLNRFQAERELHDHCLHSTVSTIQENGVPIERRAEAVPGYQSIPTHVCRYWLAPEHYPKALALLRIKAVAANPQKEAA